MVTVGPDEGGGGELGDEPPQAATITGSTKTAPRIRLKVSEKTPARNPWRYWMVIRPLSELLSGSLWSWNPQEPAPAKPKLSLVWFADSNPTLAIDGQFV